jgi:diguanylate cyclase (GGDEF)-like protein
MGVLVLLAVVWMALYGSPRDLTAVVVGVAVVWTAPLVFAGAPRYPSGDWSACALFVAISAMLGATVQRLVRQVREHAGELEQRDSERASLLARVETLAATDPLTGLPNRRTWNERLERELADRRHRPVCLAALDLDHFKPLNDTHGHEAGDRALCAIAAAWRRELRPDDTLARLGGDEFAVLLPDCDVAEGERVIERLRRATCAGLTCSAGVALWNGEESARELQARADELLYDAKRRGGDRLAAAPEGGAFSLSKR